MVEKFMQLNQQLPTELQENGAPLSQTIIDMMSVSADVRIDIFKDQASVTALGDAVTAMEKMRAIIESEIARNASNDKQQFTASMTAELRTLQAEMATLKSGGGTGEARGVWAKLALQTRTKTVANARQGPRRTGAPNLYFSWPNFHNRRQTSLDGIVSCNDARKLGPVALE
eukprot:4290902-Pleurochrysis_carterae.AAC.8